METIFLFGAVIGILFGTVGAVAVYEIGFKKQLLQLAQRGQGGE